jgi:dUTP pyrophosphatase
MNSDSTSRIFKELIDKFSPNYTESNFDSNFQKIKINFVNKSKNQNPEYATIGSSGFDLRADLNEPIVLNPNERILIPTGLFFELQTGYEIQVRPRSGLALKQGITVLNTPGTVDSDYRGEIKVILINLSSEPQTINSGDRIAQAVIASVIPSIIFSFTQVGEISTDTTRNTGGFGSTGIK